MRKRPFLFERAQEDDGLRGFAPGARKAIHLRVLGSTLFRRYAPPSPKMLRMKALAACLPTLAAGCSRVFRKKHSSSI
jgi:hypothetical protein